MPFCNNLSVVLEKTPVFMFQAKPDCWLHSLLSLSHVIATEIKKSKKHTRLSQSFHHFVWGLKIHKLWDHISRERIDRSGSNFYSRYKPSIPLCRAINGGFFKPIKHFFQFWRLHYSQFENSVSANGAYTILILRIVQAPLALTLFSIWE